MDLEQTVRAAFALREPAPDFEDVVMARLAAGAWRASHPAPRRRRILLIGTLLAVSAAAATFLLLRHSGSSPAPAAPLAQEAAVEELPVVQYTAPVSASDVPVVAPEPAAAAPPPLAPNAADVSQLCVAAAAAPPAAPRYTVLVAPLQFEADDPAIRSRVQEYYGSLLEFLRKTPGLALVGQETEATATKPADFRVTFAMNKNVDSKVIEDRAAWRAQLTRQTWTGTSFRTDGISSWVVRSLDDSNCPTPGSACGPGVATMQFSTALVSWLPRYPTPAQTACQQATGKLLAQQRRVDPTMDISLVRQRLERLAVTPTPTTRTNLWRGLRNHVRPELVLPLVTALRDSTDDAFRKEVVTVLAVIFTGDATARDALAAVAASGPDTLMRHVAERALSGDRPWRDYVVARLHDASLPTAQRLEPWYWMADAMELDQQMLEASFADLLAGLQQGNGVRVLAELLASTQKEVGEAALAVASQQGQRTMRQIGSVNHPAAPDLLIAIFDATPNYLTLGVLATRRNDPRVANKLESIATGHADLRLRESAARALRQPMDSSLIAPTGN